MAHLVRVPVAVENDDRVGCAGGSVLKVETASRALRTSLQIKSESTGPSRKNKDGVFGVGLVEGLEERRAILVLCRAVQAEVFDLAVVQIVLEDRHDRLDCVSTV